ncbi:tyrosine-type recombinase/integrase [Rhodocytophaga rosea]|uniref:Tyrosine-type recombinase/integrase n=1 Tax=Rhodocytophaga rosea TaxID=2704465 RepID=A0A6C0GEI4_9BACT|nr:site-specific integrase [Rhodocytophaga rosea]QHT66152.1 tyrosine-type recombinase/integrase [Rhodocytophaga rosea]
MSISAKLYCKKSRVKPDGTAPVYIVLRINGKPKLILTGKYINPDYFDNNSGKASRAEANSMKLNAYLGAKLASIEKIILDYQHEGRAITHELIIQAYNNEGKLLFIDFSKQELEASRKTISTKYYNDTRYRLDKLARYRPDLTFQHITFDFLQKYQYHLVAKGDKPNTIKSDFFMIRKFLNLGRKKGLTKIYPFEDFEIPSEESVKEYLTLQEVEGLHNLFDSESLSEKLQNTLFYFLIACYTGLRFSDVGRLNALYLKLSGKRYFISILMKKTKKPVEIPLSNRVVKLLSKRLGVKYEQLTELDLLKNDSLFSRKLKQSNSRVNTDVREIIAMQKNARSREITSMPGCSFSHFSTVSNLSSGSKSIGLRVSKSTNIVAYVCPLRMAHSSMPTILGVIMEGKATFRDRFKSVSALTKLMLNNCSSRAVFSPPICKAKVCKYSSIRVVLRA